MISNHAPFKGHSMWPILNDGDRLIIEGCHPEKLGPGDIVVFKSQAGHIAHRVISFKKQLAIKGDRCLFIDNSSINEVIGMVTGLTRRNTHWYWGHKGHPFKNLFAILSGLFHVQRPRLLRWSSAVIMAFFAKSLSIILSRPT